MTEKFYIRFRDSEEYRYLGRFGDNDTFLWNELSEHSLEFDSRELANAFLGAYLYHRPCEFRLNPEIAGSDSIGEKE